MKAVVDLLIWLDRFAPRRLAESWDNVGLLWGDPTTVISKVMTCLTVTPAVADEAIEQGVGLIVSHHPVLFKPVKKIAARGDDQQAMFLWKLARANVAIASPHTAFDNCEGGVNDHLADLLSLVEVGPLRPSPVRTECKVVVFVPESDREAVMEAAFDAGAGRIGQYRECSFRTSGIGTFFGDETTNPTVGQKGQRERVEELRLEFVCPIERIDRALVAIREAHSYEEPAIDVYPLRGEPDGPGIGRVGKLEQAERLGDLTKRVARVLNSPATQFVGDPNRLVQKVAIACGAGDDFVGDVRRNADVLLTGEARYHRAIEAEALGVGLIVAGHHETERPGVEHLARKIEATFPDLEVWASRLEANPLRSLEHS
jgi:dinuclear metal center YbgI/SA1388 family protein